MKSFIDRLFHKPPAENKPSSNESLYYDKQNIAMQNSDTLPDGTTSISSSRFNQLDNPQISVGSARSLGIQRDQNEDAIYTFTVNQLSGELDLSFGLYIIADGMGGHDNGEIASSIAVNKFSTHIIRSVYMPIFSIPDRKLDTSLQEIIQSAVSFTHQEVKAGASGGGTTLTAALMLGDQVTIAHVGDSRAYLIRTDGSMELLTHDHSLVNRLIEIGQITSEQAATHPQRNVLYRALGQGEPFEADVRTFQLLPGTQIVICSDGLWGVVSENELLDALLASQDVQQACQSLINLANSAGGPDNISVIIIRMPG